MKKYIFLLTLPIMMFACAEEDNEPGPNPEEKPAASLEEATITHIPLNGDAVGQGSKKISGIVKGAVPAQDRNGNENSALYFDGVDDYVDLGTTISTDSISTIAVWAKFDTLSDIMGDMELVSKSSYRQGMEIVLYEGNLEFYLVGLEDNNNIGVPIASLDTGKWYHIVAIYAREAEQMKLYINGQLKASDRAPASITKIDRLLLGNWSYEAEPRFFKGHLDDLAIYDRPLTEEEITQLYKGNTGQK